MLVLDKVALKFAEFSLLKDNVVLVEYLSEELLNVEKGIQAVKTIQRLAGGHPAAAIHNAGDKYILTTDALRFMGSQLSTESHGYIARAIVATNPASRIAANHFINMYKPLIPTRLFSDVDEAYAWVEEQLAADR